MKRGTSILILGLHAGVFVGATWAQSGGSSAGGAGSAGGSAGSTGGSGAAAAAPADSGSAAPSATPAPNAAATARGTPDMSPTNPSRRILDTAKTPGADQGNAARPALPTGVTATPRAEGVSPVSGLPTAQIPAASAAPAPVAADGSRRPADPSAAPTPTGRVGEPIVPVGSEQLPANQRDGRAARATPPTTDINASIAPTSVPVTTPPPAAQTETSPAAASQGDQVWVPGHYAWSSGQWTWVSGAYQRPPAAGATWVPGSYDATTRSWTSGYWNVSGTRR